jgi:hypothetical protein
VERDPRKGRSSTAGQVSEDSRLFLRGVRHHGAVARSGRYSMNCVCRMLNVMRGPHRRSHARRPDHATRCPNGATLDRPQQCGCRSSSSGTRSGGRDLRDPAIMEPHARQSRCLAHGPQCRVPGRHRSRRVISFVPPVPRSPQRIFDELLGQIIGWTVNELARLRNVCSSDCNPFACIDLPYYVNRIARFLCAAAVRDKT